jgi:hypothetical protein
MITWWQGKISAGKISEELLTSLDLLPTFASLAGIDVTEMPIDGIDQSSLLLDKGPSEREFFAYYKGDQLYAARLGPWKAHYKTQKVYPARDLQSHTPPLLYHLKEDPSEKYDVAEDHPDILANINIRVKEHLERLGELREPNIEGESLLEKATVSAGNLRIQNMGNFDGNWFGAQLWWTRARPGDRLTFDYDAKEEGPHEIYGFFTRARDYGIVRILVNGQPLGHLMDGYSEGIEPTGPVPFGEVALLNGRNEITIEIVGKDVRSGGFSDGYLVGIDGFLIQPIP